MFIENILSSQLPTPCYVIDCDKLRANFSLLQKRCKFLNIKPLLAVKGFPLALVYDEIREYIYGTSASSVFELLLGNCINKENHIHSPAYKQEEIETILSNCDHIVFNSFQQWEQYKNILTTKYPYVSPGLRINPEYSEILIDKYNTCLPNSRFGVTLDELLQVDITGIEGFHLHAMCDQGAKTFLNVVEKVKNKFGNHLKDLKWINFGGGQQFAHNDFNIETLQGTLNKLVSDFKIQIYVEPCEPLTANCGYLVTTVLDVMDRNECVAILDTSACCHMPDILEMPYTPDIIYPKTSNNKEKFSYTLAGVSCLAGDIIGKYEFKNQLHIGDKIIFSDMGAYTFAKETYFNGINYPAIVLYEKQKGVSVVKQFDFQDYKKNYS